MINPAFDLVVVETASRLDHNFPEVFELLHIKQYRQRGKDSFFKPPSTSVPETSTMRSILIFTSLLAVGLAHTVRSTANPPTVVVQNGVIIGNLSSGIESFVGIHYAEPPVGSRRLGRPQPLVSGFPNGTRTIHATDLPTACPQPTTANFSAFANVVQGEDCLTVNVQRPVGLNSSSKVPVLFWVRLEILSISCVFIDLRWWYVVKFLPSINATNDDSQLSRPVSLSSMTAPPS